MSDEYESQKLDALFGSSPAKQDAPEAKLPQQDDTATEEAPAKVSAEEQEPNADPKPSVSLEELLQSQEKTNKRLQDTQKYANERNQKYLDAVEKLHEAGLIDDEELKDARKSTAKAEPNEVQEASQDFLGRWNSVKEVLADQGYEPDEVLMSFDTLFGKDPSIIKEFIETPAEKRVKYVLDKGKEGLPLYKAMKQYGSLPAAVAALQKQAMEAVESKMSDEKQTSVQKPKPRIDGGGAGSKAPEYTSQSITNLMS